MLPSWTSDRNEFSSFFFYLHVTQMLLTKFGVSWPFGSEEMKNRFLRWQQWCPSWISNQNDFSYFDLLVTPMLPIKFQDNQPFVSGEEAKNRFSRWQQSWLSHQNNFSYFFICKSPQCFLPKFMWIGLSVQKKLKIDFKYGGHLGFPI